LVEKRSDGALNGGRANQDVDTSEVAAHAVDRGVDLLEIRDVGADAKRVAAGMFNFEMREVQFCFAAGEQPDFGACSSESKGQPFADTTAGAGYQNTCIGQRMHMPSNLRYIKNGTGGSGLGTRGWWLVLPVHLLFVHGLVGSVEELFRGFFGDAFRDSYRDADVYSDCVIVENQVVVAA
jgi:hypothetical protein